MTDIVERLRFDAARCEATFSKGVASNIEEAADEIERLTAINRHMRAALTDVVKWVEELGRYSDQGTVMAPVFAQAKAAIDDANGQSAK